jgi:Protein of unknown function (DUF2946)
MRHRSPVAVYLAVLAIALQALWPLLAQAKPKSAVLVPVCTVGGVTHFIELPAGKAPVEERSEAHHDHCAFCSFGGERVALSPFLQSIISTRIEEAQPLPVAVCELRSEKSSSARPRAPPAIS